MEAKITAIVSNSIFYFFAVTHPQAKNCKKKFVNRTLKIFKLNHGTWLFRESKSTATGTLSKGNIFNTFLRSYQVK